MRELVFAKKSLKRNYAISAEKAASSDEVESGTYSGGEGGEVVREAWGKSRPVEFSSRLGGASDGGGVVACHESLSGFAPYFGDIFSGGDEGQCSRGGSGADGE